MSGHDDATHAGPTLRDLGQYLINLAEDLELAITDLSLSAVPLPTMGKEQHGVDDLRKLSRMAYQEYQERNLRAEYFDFCLFGEPAWDILLDLFIAKAGGLRISVTSACIASRVPPTTALRWLNVLERRDLILRDTDRTDKRRTWVELSDQGFQAMAACLRERGKRRASNIKNYSFATASPIQRRI